MPTPPVASDPDPLVILRVSIWLNTPSNAARILKMTPDDAVALVLREVKGASRDYWTTRTMVHVFLAERGSFAPHRPIPAASGSNLFDKISDIVDALKEGTEVKTFGLVHRVDITGIKGTSPLFGSSKIAWDLSTGGNASLTGHFGKLSVAAGTKEAKATYGFTDRIKLTGTYDYASGVKLGGRIGFFFVNVGADEGKWSASATWPKQKQPVTAAQVESAVLKAVASGEKLVDAVGDLSFGKDFIDQASTIGGHASDVMKPHSLLKRAASASDGKWQVGLDLKNVHSLFKDRSEFTGALIIRKTF